MLRLTVSALQTEDEIMAGRSFLLQMMALPFAGLVSLAQAPPTQRKPLNIMMKSA